jgi:hypothetical protein
MTRLLSVNVGLPRDVTWNGKTVRTAVWKSPVDGRRMVRKLAYSSPAARTARIWPSSLIRAQRDYRRMESEICKLARTGGSMRRSG